MAVQAGTRREFIRLVAGAAAVAAPAVAAARGATVIEAVVFDLFTIVDPSPVFALAERLFPGKGAQLSATWRARQFEYTWLRALTGTYADFWTVTGDALVYAANAAGVALGADARAELMDAYLRLKAHPDAQPTLAEMKDSGLRLAPLSNFDPRMLDAAIDSAGLGGVFEHRLSTDARRTYKPHARAYQMAIDTFGLTRGEIVFAAFGGWDAAGAKAFGYTTFWVNRLGLPVEELGVRPDGIGRDLTDLAAFLRRLRANPVSPRSG